MNLYFRLFWTLWRARFKPRIVLGDVIELKLQVWPNDLDINGHMNNGRYLTLIDLAVIEYFARAGFLRILLARGWRPVVGGSIIAFRRALKPFQIYTLRFSMPCWDERWSYMRFEFRQSNQLMAVGHTKGAIVSSQGLVGVVDRFGALGMNCASPAFPESVLAWIAADQLIRA